MPLILNGTTGVSGVDGTAGTPAAQGTDTNTGIYFPAADTIAFAEGGVESMRLDSSGNVGIGTTSLSAVSNYRTLTINGTNGALIDLKYGDTLGGRLVGSSGGLSFETGGATPISFYTNNTERARIDSSGTAMFNTTTQLIRGGETFRVQLNAGIASFITSTAGNPVIALRNSGTNGFMMAFNNASAEIGTISSSGSNVAYNTSSDYRLKENIQPMSGALTKVAQIKPVTFTWKADGSDGQGFIAHELQEVVPDCVTGEKDAVDENGNPKYQGVDTSFLVATLTAAIQELSAKLDAAEARIAALEAK